MIHFDVIYLAHERARLENTKTQNGLKSMWEQVL